MAKQNINVGTTVNSRTGDTLRDAFTKVNNNFTELYNLASADVQIPSQAGKSGKVLKTTGTELLFENVSYNELTDRPTLFSGSYNDLSNKPMLFSGNYTDLSGKPTLFSGSYADLTDKPALFSGSYADLTDKPVLFSGSYNDLTDKPVLFSGSYTDLTNRPAALLPIIKSVAAASTDFADFQARIAAL